MVLEHFVNLQQVNSRVSAILALWNISNFSLASFPVSRMRIFAPPKKLAAIRELVRGARKFTWVVFHELGNIQNESVDDNPSVALLVVWFDVVECENFRRHGD